ncbi:MAG TPA: anti-sigma factor [Nakamurella sp.]|nr:anti-sigma factor [Nakamurella sp.]
MQHPDPDDLTLLAMGEPIEMAIDAHLAECEDCRAEVESMRRTVELAELSNYGEGTRQPAEHIWNAIAAELGFAAAQTTNGSSHAPQAGTGSPWPVASEPGQTSEPTPAALEGQAASTHPPTLRAVPGTGTPEPGPPRATDRARRRPRWAAPVAALLIGAALGAGVLVVAQNRSDNVTVEATAPLTSVPAGPLAGEDGQLGQAELVATTQGQQVRVSATDLPPMTGTSYEVWLFGNDGKMISLGSLDQGKGEFTVPGDISTQEYRTVDISDEPPDGNPKHSGISMVRGSFS